jgi:Tfp pilus assembly protein PilN
MSQVNLLPPEIRQRAQTRRVTAMVAGAGVVVLVLIVFFYFLQAGNLTRVNDDVAAQQGINADIQSNITKLQPFADLKAKADSEQKILASVYAGEVSFSGVLMDLSRVIPSDEFLTNFSATLNAPAAPAVPGAVTTPAGGVPLIGQLTFAGTTKGTATLATWLTRLDSVRGWVNSWVQSFTESAPASGVYTFSGGTDLSSDATTQRGRKGTAAVGG